jgi:nicotinamidase/pyrazinamidase
MTSQGSAPSLFTPEDAYKGPYTARLDAFMESGLTAGLRPAREDTEKLALVLVDVQHDFVDPEGTLSVPGAQDDVARLLSWFYAHAGRITTIYASLDTHLPGHIFFSPWWINPRTGERPRPFTVITLEDVERETWAPVTHREWSWRYLRSLREQAKKDLMIWPQHTMAGTIGHILTPPVSEAVVWHSAARHARPTYLHKGRTARTEFYGIFGAEVPDPDDPASALNTALLDEVMSHDRVYIAGEAKSHCVLESVRQIIGRYGDQPEMLSRLHVLSDCMSSVAHPEIDFDALAEAEFAGMRERGVRFVTSAEPVE